MTTTGLPEEIYTSVQNLMRKTPVLLFGSGFSCGFNLPQMAALGEHLATVVGPKLSSKEAQAAWSLSLDAVKKNLEAGLNTIANGDEGCEEIISVLREETAKLISDKTKEAELEILKSPTPTSLAAVRLLCRIFNGAPQGQDCISIVTTNYDTLVELFCDLGGLPLDTGFSGFRIRRLRIPLMFQTLYHRATAVSGKKPRLEHKAFKTVRLYKPHGSISWNVTPEGPVETIDGLSQAPKAIIIPGPSKYRDALVSPIFDAMRTEMNNVINKAPALFCLGFGFNDDHLQGVIRNRLKAGMPMIILTRGLTESHRTLLLDFPHVIAICANATGSECHAYGTKSESPIPFWQLDDFLKTFIE